MIIDKSKDDKIKLAQSNFTKVLMFMGYAKLSTVKDLKFDPETFTENDNVELKRKKTRIQKS
jgi:hypothetical protein